MRYVKVSREQFERLERASLTPAARGALKRKRSSTRPARQAPAPRAKRARVAGLPTWLTAGAAIATITDWSHELELQWTRAGWIVRRDTGGSDRGD